MLSARFLSLLAFCLSAAFFCPALLAALQSGYSIQILQTEQGLPQNNINSIIQSRDGYLYLGTFGGLVRFDGVRFRVFDSANTPQLQNSRITALFEDHNGVIWIGHETGDLTRLHNGQFEPTQIPGPPHRERILSITTDAQDSPILFYESAAVRFAKTGALIEPDISPDQQRGVTACVRDNSGDLWVLRAGSLSLLTKDKFQPVQFDRFAADQLIYSIGAARDEGIWIATRDRIRKRVQDKWTQELFTGRPIAVSALLELRDGSVAAATMDQGIFLFTKNALLQMDRKDGLPPDWVRALCEDREGNLWAALGSGGLVALRPARAMALAPADRWKGRSVLGVTATSNDTLWVGTAGAGLYRFTGGRGAPFGAEQGLTTNAFIWSFTDDDAGRLWVSTAEGGVSMLNGDRFQSPPGLEDFTTPVRVLYLSPNNGAIFMGAHSGLLKYQRGATQSFGANLVASDVRCILEQTNGVVWFGMFGGGLGKLENGKTTQFRKSNGLASDFVQCLYLDAADDSLWIGTAESGLSRYKNGSFKSITTAHGLRDNVICHIADDGLGYFWISSHGGIMRVAKSDLNRCADGSLATFQCLSYGETDGLPSLQSSGGLQPTGSRTSDGLLWFATTKGIVAIDPAHVRTNQLPLVLVEELRVNDVPIIADKTNVTRIPPGRQRFDFEYTAISYAAPDRVLFKYKLEGLEQDWIGPTTKRTVSYSHLPPGDYNFRLVACNSDGAWNESGARLAFTVLPFFWQTLWFRAAAIFLAIAIAGAIALLIARARYHRQIELAERQRGIERERARIAQDIHDDLGSSLTRIILLSQSARGDLDSPEYAAKDLDRIYDTARNLTRSLDEIVWAVNPRHDTLDSLATYLGKFAQDFLGAANIRCRLDLPVSLPSWPLTAETRHNVFLAFKEALNNAVKHAQASEVRISLILENSAFTLNVEDNGRGFSPSAVASETTDTQDGLANMRKRLTEVGGSCQIDSKPNEGTRVRFVVPLAAGAI